MSSPHLVWQGNEGVRDLEAGVLNLGTWGIQAVTGRTGAGNNSFVRRLNLSFLVPTF